MQWFSSQCIRDNNTGRKKKKLLLLLLPAYQGVGRRKAEEESLETFSNVSTGELLQPPLAEGASLNFTHSKIGHTKKPNNTAIFCLPQRTPSSTSLCHHHMIVFPRAEHMRSTPSFTVGPAMAAMSGSSPCITVPSGCTGSRLGLISTMSIATSRPVACTASQM